MKNKEKDALTQYIASILDGQPDMNLSYNGTSYTQYQLTRILAKQFPMQTLMWAFMLNLVNRTDGYLILDDTIIEKPYSQANNSPGSIIRWVYSHKEKKAVSGIQVVFLLFVVGDFRIPLCFEIYDGTKSKIQLALSMFSLLRNTYKLKKQTILFDSWYSSRSILKRLHDYGWTFVGRLKCNRNLNGKQVRYHDLNPYWVKRGVVSSLQVQVVKHGNLYIATNRLTMSKKEIRSWYLKRGVIEEFNKCFKNYGGGKSCQCRLAPVWRSHLFLCCIAFMALEFESQRRRLTIKQAWRNLSSEDYTTCINLWMQVLELA